MYKIMYNEIGRCGVAHRRRLRRLLYLRACFFDASTRSVPGPCSIQWKTRFSLLWPSTTRESMVGRVVLHHDPLYSNQALTPSAVVDRCCLNSRETKLRDGTSGSRGAFTSGSLVSLPNPAAREGSKRLVGVSFRACKRLCSSLGHSSIAKEKQKP